ncbi:hypothetical protein [Actinophytocola sp.]|uniref:hypothetical protein n=1 Tax=Actinophytocola sp. TaxID=1872138 RepID=UPI002D2B2F16|nr:hypothetical protein [Actinophytocola sp.]HYQ65051.1 hypothetical protein [Actinophytocola sp.]
MPRTDEELAAENARVEQVLAGGARERLSALPGVVQVTIGLRETGGVPTSEFAIKVYVEEKRPVGALPPDQVVPARVADVPTDVCQVPTASPYAKAVGGIVITNGYVILPSPGNTKMEAGTLGFVAVRDDKDQKPVMLLSGHTMSKYGGKVGDYVYHPKPGPDDVIHDSDQFPRKPRTASNQVGSIVKIVEAESDVVDCAIAEVDFCHSSCCDCGTEFDHVIPGLNVNGGDAISGVTAATTHMLVFKVGITTGRTAGIVVAPSMPATLNLDGGTQKTYQQQIHIISVEPGKRFADHGDSGALIVDKQGRAVGLLMGGHPPPPGQDESTAPTFANQIALVTNALKIKLPAKAKQAATATTAFRSASSATALPWPLAPLHDRLGESASGRWLRAAVARHRGEVIELVNHRRRATVAWHRGHGPAWFAAFARSARHPGYRLPDEIDGVTRERVVTALYDVLVAEGGPELVADLVAQREFLLDVLVTCATVEELLTLVERSPSRLG